MNNKNKIWVREAKKVNRKKVDRDIQNIVREYQEKHNTVECEAEITFVDKKMGATLRIPSYLEPIIKVAGASCEQIPWIYGREQSSIYDKFQYSSYGKSKEWKTMNIVMKKIELESFDCFSQEGFLDNYYNFVYKTLKRISNGIDDKVKRYLAFYAMEKIYTLELFEFETQMIYDYQNNNNNLTDEQKELLEYYLERIYLLNGAKTKIEIAKEVLTCFFDNIGMKEEQLKAKIDALFNKIDYETLHEGIKDRKELENNLRKSTWAWYDKRHEDAINSDKNLEEWRRCYMCTEDKRKIMIFVMRASVRESLRFELKMAKITRLWGEKEECSIFGDIIFI